MPIEFNWLCCNLLTYVKTGKINIPVFFENRASNKCLSLTLIDNYLSQEKRNKLFAGLESVHIAKNCDLGLENAALGRAFSRPRSQSSAIQTSQPANYIYTCFLKTGLAINISHTDW